MTAATADRSTETLGTPQEETVAIKTAVEVFIGTLVNKVGATGRLNDGAATAAETFAGMVVGLPDGSATGVAGGTVRARIAWGHRVSLNISTAIRTNTSLGKGVHVLDNQTVAGATTAGTAAKRLLCGTLISWDASDKSTGWVELRRGGVVAGVLG